jgi:catechol 2,3-dioxygenase-like lactoylglutathione lyase family enzyme
MAIEIKGLHHNAYRCRDSEETRKFYEDFLGLPLANAFKIKTTHTGRGIKKQHDFDLHISLEVEMEHLQAMFAKGKAAGIEVRGVSNHGFIDSIYFRDPDGYVIELSAKKGEDMPHDYAEARVHLDTWQAAKVG